MDRHGQLIDPFSGQADLNNRLIRAVGEAAVRFREDALRLLRAARFAAQLNFAVEQETFAAMQKTAPLLVHVAVERIRDELIKLLDSFYPQTGCQIIVDTKLFANFSEPRLMPLFEAGTSVAWRFAHLGSLAQKWSLLCYACKLPAEAAKEVTLFLRMAKREAEEIARLVEILSQLAPEWDQPKPVKWEKLLLQYGWAVCMDVDMLLQACWWKKRDRQSSQDLIDTYAKMPVKTMKELAVTGLDLQRALQKQPGEWIQHILSYLLEQTALHGLENSPEKLVEAAKKEVERYEHQAGNS
jgi:tRNA nucleotidyltransferase (CCA-adding enzyme)